jgi:hypothetical protein
MVEVISSTEHKAKKVYNDDCWEFISEWIGEGCPVGTIKKPEKITFSEARMLVKYRRDYKSAGKIQIGQVYVRQFNKYEGDAYTWRAKKELYELACKYDLFPEI